jgi:hypothetical protein
LPDEPAAARAERGPDRAFPAARGRARQEQVRDVDAGDQEDGRDRGQQREERGPGVAHDRVAEGHEDEAEVRVRLGIPLGQAGREGAHLGLGLGHGYAGAEAPDEVKLVESAHLEALVAERQGKPHLGVLGPAESRGHDPDHRHRAAVERDGAAGQRGIAGEALAPEPVAQHHRLGQGNGFVRGTERAADQGRNAERLEEAGAHEASRELLRPFEAGERGTERIRAHRCEGLKGAARRPKVDEVGRGHRGPGIPSRSPPAPHEALGLGIRQRAEKDAARHAEDGGVGADPEAEGHDRSGREPTVFEQEAHSVADVLK